MSDPKRPLTREELADIRSRVERARNSQRQLSRTGYAREDRERLLWHVDLLEAELEYAKDEMRGLMDPLVRE